jgi:hypothetical protein
MALGSTQPLAEMSTKNISWGVNAAGADNLTSADCLEISTYWNLRACPGTALGREWDDELGSKSD